MAGGAAAAATTTSYSATTGFIFIFNLIVGAGALTIPHAFSQVGLIWGSVAISFLAVASYISATFVIETMAVVNALPQRRSVIALSNIQDGDSSAVPSDRAPLLNNEKDTANQVINQRQNPTFHLNQKVELAEMAEVLFSRSGLVAFYASVAVYLFGDLAIYAVAVPKSLRELTCPRPSSLSSTGQWDCILKLNSRQVYQLYVLLFAAALGPLVFGNVQKTKVLALVSTAIRHISFAAMIFLAMYGILITGDGREFSEVVMFENPMRLPTFFGVCIYSFMCHHSLPGLVTPISDKSRLTIVLISSYGCVLVAYVALCVSATFRFHPEEIDDVYTLNFKAYSVVGTFLSLFPVVTLSANFPVIGITLRESLRVLLTKYLPRMSVIPLSDDDDDGIGTSGRRRRERNNNSSTIYGLVAVVPPFIVAFFTEDVSMLVGFTGAYAGLAIQWVIPACLVYKARSRVQDIVMTGGLPKANPYRSWFSGTIWIYLTLTLASLTLILVTSIHLL